MRPFKGPVYARLAGPRPHFFMFAHWSIMWDQTSKNVSSYTGGFIYCIPGNLDKGSVQFVNTVYKWRTNIIRGPLISQFWQDKISRGSIFATVTGKHEKRALKFAI